MFNLNSPAGTSIVTKKFQLPGLTASCSGYKTYARQLSVIEERKMSSSGRGKNKKKDKNNNNNNNNNNDSDNNQKNKSDEQQLIIPTGDDLVNNSPYINNGVSELLTMANSVHNEVNDLLKTNEEDEKRNDKMNHDSEEGDLRPQLQEPEVEIDINTLSLALQHQQQSDPVPAPHTHDTSEIRSNITSPTFSSKDSNQKYSEENFPSVDETADTTVGSLYMNQALAEKLFKKINKNDDGHISLLQLTVIARDNSSEEGKMLHDLLGLPDHVRQEDGTKDMIVKLFADMHADKDPDAVTFDLFWKYLESHNVKETKGSSSSDEFGTNISSNSSPSMKLWKNADEEEEDGDSNQEHEKWKKILKSDQDIVYGKRSSLSGGDQCRKATVTPTNVGDGAVSDHHSIHKSTKRRVSFPNDIDNSNHNNDEHKKFVHEETLHEISGNLDFDTRNYMTELHAEELNIIKQKLRANSYTAHGSDLRLLFKKMDKDGSGFIDTQELLAVVRKLLPNVTDEAINSLMSAVDLDGSGTIDEQEFIEFIGDGKTGISREEKKRHKRVSIVGEQKQKHQVAMVDSVMIKQVRNKLKAASYSSTGTDLSALFDKLDVDHSGEIDMVELQKALKKLLPAISNRELKLLMNVADADKNGVLDKNEFIAFITDTPLVTTTSSSSSSSLSLSLSGSANKSPTGNMNPSSVRNCDSSSVGGGNDSEIGKVRSPKAIALEKTIEDLEKQLKEKRNELQEVYEEQGPESNERNVVGTTMKRAEGRQRKINSDSGQSLSPDSKHSPSSQFPQGFSRKDTSKYGIHKETWKSSSQRPKLFQEKHQPIFIEDHQVYKERAKSLPKRKSMSECINKSSLQLDETLKRKVVDSIRNRKLGLSEKSKHIDVRTLKSRANGTEIRKAPKIVVGKSKCLELHAGNIVSHIKTHQITKNSKGTGENEVSSQIGSEKNLSPLRTPSPMKRRRSILTIRANNYDTASLGRKGFTMDGSLAANVTTGARTV